MSYDRWTGLSSGPSATLEDDKLYGMTGESDVRSDCPSITFEFYVEYSRYRQFAKGSGPVASEGRQEKKKITTGDKIPRKIRESFATSYRLSESFFFITFFRASSTRYLTCRLDPFEKNALLGV